jgi:hypothetical protein
MQRIIKNAVRRNLRRFLRDSSGNLSLMVALTALPLIAVVGMAIDVERASSAKQALRNISDGAALAAASAPLGTKPNVRTEIASQFVEANRDALSGAKIISKDIKVKSDTIDVQLGVRLDGQLTKVFGLGIGASAATVQDEPTDPDKYKRIDVGAKSSAKYNPVPGPCMLALSPTKNRAATFSGSAQVTLQNCTVMSNSDKSNSMYFGGAGAHVTAACFVTVGKIDGGSSQYTMTTCDKITENFIATPDPYASLPVPPKSGNCKTAGNSANLTEGYYCSLSINRDVTLGSGKYYIANGGQLSVPNQKTLTGTDVTFYFEGNATIDIAGGATVKLSAPTIGTYAGMLFFGDRNNTSLQRMNGTSNSYLTGAMYFKSGNVDFRGNYSGQNGCMQIVADTIDMSGNATMTNSCDSYGLAKISGAQIVRLAD